MHKIFCDPTLQPIPEHAIRGLPIGAIKTKLNDTLMQRLIPFLGAGASLKPRPHPALKPPARRPRPEEIDQICASFGISDRSKRFVEIAIQFAQLLDQQTTQDAEDIKQAPSSWQLARRLAEMLQLEPLRGPAEVLRDLLAENPQRADHLDLVRRIAEVIGLSRSVPQLLTVASYFNVGGGREVLRSDIGSRFKTVTEVTPIQETIASRAKQFVSARNASQAIEDKPDYLIITTNYDQLIELRLQELGVPTCVLTVDRKSRVWTRFMEGTKEFLKLNDKDFLALEKKYKFDPNNLEFKAANFQLTDKSHSLALVYKIHGCPVIDEREKIDNIIISDQDYVLFIQKNGRNNELVPAYVAKRALESRFLFLGYSFADWNVRSLYKQFVKGRKSAAAADDDEDIYEDRDYVVMRSYEDTDNYFLRDSDVSILLTELDEFARLV